MDDPAKMAAGIKGPVAAAPDRRAILTNTPPVALIKNVIIIKS